MRSVHCGLVPGVAVSRKDGGGSVPASVSTSAGGGAGSGTLAGQPMATGDTL